MEIVQKTRQRKMERRHLLPKRTKQSFERNPKRFSAPPRQWPRRLRQLGITDKRVLAGHSWRHRFKDLCRSSGIAKDVHDALTGHVAGDVGSTYGLPATRC
jgi:hypothetical protein